MFARLSYARAQRDAHLWVAERRPLGSRPAWRRCGPPGRHLHPAFFDSQFRNRCVSDPRITNSSGSATEQRGGNIGSTSTITCW